MVFPRFSYRFFLRLLAIVQPSIWSTVSNTHMMPWVHVSSRCLLQVRVVVLVIQDGTMDFEDTIFHLWDHKGQGIPGLIVDMDFYPEMHCIR